MAVALQADSAPPIDTFLRTRGAFNARYVRMVVYTTAALLDVLAICLAFLAVTLFRLREQDLALMGLTAAMFFVVGFYVRTYGFAAMQSMQLTLMRVCYSWVITLALVLLLVFGQKNSADFSRSVFLPSVFIAPLLVLIERSLLIRYIRRNLKRQFVCELFLEDGVTAHVPSTLDHVSATDLQLSPDPDDPISLHNFSCLTAHYDRIVVSCPPERRQAWALYLQAVACNGELVVQELAGIAPVTDQRQAFLPTVKVAVGPLDLRNRMLKRSLDLVFTVPLIIVLSPLMLAIALAVKLDTRGPVFFRQERMGRNNRLFHVLKFRSMRHERTDATGARSAARDDDRVTRVGRIIRATSADELPQLFNVLGGDMALVGPRPHALGSRAGQELFWEVDARYWLRHSIKPGITGLAQVRGYRGATNVREDLSNRLHHDLEYLSGWSIFRDIYILFKTVSVLRHRNAY